METAPPESDTALTVADVSYEDLAGAIDHSLLRPELTRDEVIAGCRLAAKYQVASVCVRPADVALAGSLLEGSGVAVGTVVGFPHGSHSTSTKRFEAEVAVAEGASELDMVINIGALRSGDDSFVESDIRTVVGASGSALVKVILENAYLDDEQKVRGCRLAEAAGADYVKTSTGFAPGGATIADLKLMRATVSSAVKVKAAGGVRNLDGLLEVLSVGCQQGRRHPDGRHPRRLSGPHPLGRARTAYRRAPRRWRRQPRPERSGHHLYLVGGHQGHPPTDGVPDRTEHQFARGGDAPADDDPLRSEHGDDVGEDNPQPAGGAADGADTPLIALGHACIDLLDRRLARRSSQHVGSSQGFDAPMVTAAAQRAIGQHRLVGDLTGDSEGAKVELAVDHHPATDPRAQR